RCGKPSVANAALCIAGESECATGRPMSQTCATAYLFPCLLNLGSAETRSGWWIRSSPAGAGAPGREARRSSLISVLDPVRLVLLQGPREGVVPRAVVLRDEVEVRDVRRAGRAFERRLSRAADRRRRKS